MIFSVSVAVMTEKFQFNFIYFFIYFSCVCAAIIFEKYKKSIAKLQWKKIITIFYIWMGILAIRKFSYYIPLYGVLQTQDAILCIKKGILVLIWISSIQQIFYVIMFLLALNDNGINHENLVIGIPLVLFGYFLGFFLMIMSIVSMIMLGSLPYISPYANISIFFNQINFSLNYISFKQLVYIYSAAPLIILKMFTSGKYLGLFTSLLIPILLIYFYNIRKKLAVEPFFWLFFTHIESKFMKKIIYSFLISISIVFCFFSFIEFSG